MPILLGWAGSHPHIPVMSILIRPAQLSDLADLAHLHAQFRPQQAVGDNTFAFVPASPGTSDFFADILRREDCHLLIAETGGRIAGYLWWRRDEHRQRPEEALRSRAAIQHVQIHRTFESQGLEQKLLDAVDKHCLSLGIADIVFEAPNDEAVHEHFATKGFRPTRMMLTRAVAPLDID